MDGDLWLCVCVAAAVGHTRKRVADVADGTEVFVGVYDPSVCLRRRAKCSCVSVQSSVSLRKES